MFPSHRVFDFLSYQHALILSFYTYNMDTDQFTYYYHFAPSSLIFVTTTQFQECFQPLVIDTFGSKQHIHQKFAQTFHSFF